MPPKPPVILAKKGAVSQDHTHGGRQQHHHHHRHQQQQPKSTQRLKLLVRRLPPALTKDEFLQIFGDEWKMPGDKIDWLEYRPGKIKGPGKQSLQSRAYVHLTNEAHIKSFEAKFLSLTFHDAKGSYKDPQLKQLLPSLLFAPNQRVPSHKQRVDGRQGTIDQDPEFIAFLERETQPVTKPPPLDQALAQEKPKEKVSSTPLLDDLREKKQNKARANAKHRDGKEQEKSSGRGRGDKQDSKTPVKVLAKNQKAQPAASPAPASPAPSTASGRKRERGTPAPNQIKSMLQRDLGLTQQSSKRGGAKDVSSAKADKATPSAPADSAASNATPAKSNKSRSGRNKDKTNAQPPTAAAAQENAKPPPPAPTGILKKPAQQQQAASKGPRGKANNTPAAPAANASTTSNTTSPAPSNKPAKPSPQPSAGSTKAYLKHANASQGVTEALLLTALSVFGPVIKVDIDKRKGTALAEFKDTDSLKAAMAKKNVPVAQGAVEVLEFREKPAAGGRAAQGTPRNSSGGGGGGGANRGRGGRARGGAAAANGPNGSAAANGTAASSGSAAPTVAKGDAT